METVIENFQGLQDVSPILPLIIQPLVQHVHNVHKIGAAKKETKLLESKAKETR